MWVVMDFGDWIVWKDWICRPSNARVGKDFFERSLRSWPASHRNFAVQHLGVCFASKTLTRTPFRRFGRRSKGVFMCSIVVAHPLLYFSLCFLMWEKKVTHTAAYHFLAVCDLKKPCFLCCSALCCSGFWCGVIASPFDLSCVFTMFQFVHILCSLFSAHTLFSSLHSFRNFNKFASHSTVLL